MESMVYCLLLLLNIGRTTWAEGGIPAAVLPDISTLQQNAAAFINSFRFNLPTQRAVVATCGDESDRNTVWQSPKFPTLEGDLPGYCTLTLTPPEGTCALRVNFDDLAFRNSFNFFSSYTACREDFSSFRMSYQGGVTQHLCTDLTDYEGILELDPKNLEPTVFLLQLDPREAFKFRVNITLVSCRGITQYKSPRNCGIKNDAPISSGRSDSASPDLNESTAQAVESGKVELNPPTSPVAGTETGIGEWPWMVAIKRRTDSISFMGLPDFSVNLSMCNGVLLDERHVLTAASCVHSTAVRPVSVTGIRALLGEHDVYASDEILTYNSSVARVVFPLTFNPRLWKHNLAILQLSKPVDYTRNIRPICLPVDYNVFRTDDAVVTRWEDEPLLGVPNGLTNKVVAFNVQILNETYCSQSLYSSFDEEEISVPLVRRDQTGAYFLAGVSKSNINCNDLFPTVYTRIGQISNFLNIALQLTATSMK